MDSNRLFVSETLRWQSTTPPKPLKIALFNPTKDNGSELADDSYHNWTSEWPASSCCN